MTTTDTLEILRGASVQCEETEHCWLCCGRGYRPCYKSDQHPTGYEKCQACAGTGYGESIETYWKRMGISPKKTQ